MALTFGKEKVNESETETGFVHALRDVIELRCVVFEFGVCVLSCTSSIYNVCTNI